MFKYFNVSSEMVELGDKIKDHNIYFFPNILML